MLQPSRTEQNYMNENERQNDMDENERHVSSILSKTFKEMKNKGIHVNILNTDEEKIPGCKENEIFFMNKEKMFLLSSEKIVHDISGNNSLTIYIYLFLLSSSPWS